MYDELKKVCEEILSDETKTKEFLAMSSIEEMYNFFKSKIPNLSTSEFDDFIVELLENYERMQLEGNTIDAEMLQNVSGGAKFGSKVTAASLALLMGMPAGGAHASATDGTNKFSTAVKNVGRKVSNTSSSYGHWLAETSPAKKFPKASAWLKNHPHVASVVSAVLILAAIAGVTYGTVKLKQHYFPGASQTPVEAKSKDLKVNGKKVSEMSPDEAAEALENPEGLTPEVIAALKARKADGDAGEEKDEIVEDEKKEVEGVKVNGKKVSEMSPDEAAKALENPEGLTPEVIAALKARKAPADVDSDDGVVFEEKKEEEPKKEEDGHESKDLEVNGKKVSEMSPDEAAEALKRKDELPPDVVAALEARKAAGDAEKAAAEAARKAEEEEAARKKAEEERKKEIDAIRAEIQRVSKNSDTAALEARIGKLGDTTEEAKELRNLLDEAKKKTE